MMRKRFLLALSMALFAFTAATLWFTRGSMPENEVRDVAPAAGQVAIGGDYTLVDQDGRTIHSADLKGKLQLVFFGFTHCPDVCPVSMMTITNALNALADKAVQVAPVFITIDPGRDTPAVLKDYVQNFHPSFLALTGTDRQVKQAEDAYKVYAQKNAANGKTATEYSMDHSGFIYLMDREGKYLAHFRHDDPETKVVDTIRPYLQ